MMHRLFIYISLLTILTSCDNNNTSNFTAKPTALGKMNEIVIIADNNIWEGSVGDSLRYYFESAYPIIPSPEPIFDLRHFTPAELTQEPLRKELRTYLIVADMSDEDSPTMLLIKQDLGEERYVEVMKNDKLTSTIGSDKWARGQMVAYLFAQNEEKLAIEVGKKFSTIANRVTAHDQKQLEASIYAVTQINGGLSTILKEDRNLNVDIPRDYQTVIGLDTSEVLWLRKDNKEATLNIVFQRFPYNNVTQLDKENIIMHINNFGEEYVTSTTKGSHLIVNEEDLPIYDYNLDLDGNYTTEYRGIWEMTKDFYGGPFAAYAILDEDKTHFNLITVFVLAPGKSKRNYMKQLDYIVKRNYLSTSNKN